MNDIKSKRIDLFVSFRQLNRKQNDSKSQIQNYCFRILKHYYWIFIGNFKTKFQNLKVCVLKFKSNEKKFIAEQLFGYSTYVHPLRSLYIHYFISPIPFTVKKLHLSSSSVKLYLNPNWPIIFRYTIFLLN